MCPDFYSQKANSIWKMKGKKLNLFSSFGALYVEITIPMLVYFLTILQCYHIF